MQNINNKVKNFDDIKPSGYYTFDEEVTKCKYIYANSIIYLDSVNEYSKGHQNIFSDANAKPNMYLTQFNLLQYFLLENPGYKSKFQNKPDAIELTPLGSLEGSTENEITVFGMLLVNESKKVQLQDGLNIVTLDISQVQNWGEGYFTSGSCVLCQGVYKNEVIKAKLLIHPPPVWNKATFEEKYEKDFFGAISKAFKNGSEDDEVRKKAKDMKKGLVNTNPKKKLEENFLNSFLNRDLAQNKILYPKYTERPIDINGNIEKMRQSQYDSTVIETMFTRSSKILQDEFFLILSNPDLTNHNVLSAIEKIVLGYQQRSSGEKIKTPFMIVFMGNFIPEQSYNSFKVLASAFENLTNILLKNTFLVQNCYFVFLPGPDDFSLFNGYPKHPFIPSVIDNLKKKIPNVLNATNPCRFSLFGKEVVIFRDDLNKKLSRNSIKTTEVVNQIDAYVHTILSQGNLTPVPLSIVPRIWHLGQCMTMLPLPDILILGDVVEDFTKDINGEMIVVNPGNFSKDFSFSQIFPLRMKSQSCKVDN